MLRTQTLVLIPWVVDLPQKRPRVREAVSGSALRGHSWAVTSFHDTTSVRGELTGRG